MRINSVLGKGVARYAPTLVLLLAACAPALAEVPTVTATMGPEVTVTETIELMRTIAPTQTATITPFPYPTPENYWLNGLPDAMFSPKDLWIAWPLCCDRGGSLILVEEIEGEKQWELVYDQEKYGWFETSHWPVRWSSDGQYFYYSIEVNLDGYCNRYSDYADLIRLILIQGKKKGFWITQ